MKKIVYFISVLLTCTCLNRSAQAFVWPDFTPLIPFSPQFCVMCIPPAIDWAVNSVDQVKDAKNRLKEMTDVTAIKQNLASYAADLGNTALNYATQKLSARKRVISYSRTILDSKRDGVDVKKEDSVKVDFVNLFLQYPSKKSKIKNAYRKKGDYIKMDTTLEMYITSNEMMKELCGAKGKGCELATALGDNDVSTEFSDFKDMGMMLQISLVERCFMTGEYCGLIGTIGCEPSKDEEDSEPSGELPTEGESSDEDKVCHWKTSLQIARMYEKIMRYNEMLIYMQAQYEAVIGIDNLAKIRAAKEKEKEEKGALVDDKYFPQRTYHAQSEISATLMFADEEEEELSDEDLEEFAKYEENITNHENILSGDFEVNKKATGFESVLDDKGDDIASLELLANVQKYLNEAKVYHNLKQMLPDYRKTFKSYKETQEYHDKTVEYLQESGECAKSYLEPHYKNPAKTWFGEGCDYYDAGTIYCHYVPERSIEDTNESKGLFDDICPDDSHYKCFIQKLEDSDFDKGVAGALLAYYNEGKAADALQETETYLKEGEQQNEVVAEKTSDNAYTAHVDIKGGDETVGDDESYVTGRDNPDIMDKDNANVKDVTVKASSTQDKQNTNRDDQAVDENMRDPKKAESLAEETRKGHLMNWVWGATMADVISKDLDSASSKFGERKSKFPLWNDQKEFYDQYLDGKYENISDYMKRASMVKYIVEAAKAINEKYSYKKIEKRNSNGMVILTITPEEIRQAIAGAIESVPVKEKADETKAEIDKLIAEEDATLLALKENHQKTMASLEKEKSMLQQKLGETNTALDVANDEYNKAGRNIASSKNTGRSSDENEKYSNQIKSKYRTSIDVKDSPINKQFTELKGESDQLKAEAEAQRKTKEIEAKKLEATSKLLANSLKKTKEKIEEERRNFVQKYSQAEQKARAEFSKKVAELSGTSEADDAEMVAALTAAIEAAGKTFDSTVSFDTAAASGAGSMISCLRTKAAQIAEDTQKSFADMRKTSNNIYYNESAGIVSQKHGDMINKMMAISDCAVNGVPSAPIAKAVFGKMCDDVSCRQADMSKDGDGLINYFVGALGVQDDLKTPTPPVAFSSAPMREIFHFDIADYESIEKYYKDGKMDNPSNKDITITSEGFLKLGEDMQSSQEETQEKLDDDDDISGTFPEIWKYVLKRHAYGQKQFDLSKILGNESAGDEVRGNPEQSYLRSGSFPCYIDGKVIDVNNFGYTVGSASDSGLYTHVSCKGLSLKDGKVFDYVADGSVAGSSGGSGKIVADSSELGSILAYVPDSAGGLIDKVLGADGKSELPRKLTFNDTLQQAVNIISKTEELGKNKSEDAKFYLANRTLLDRNQFGDYLNQVEQEALAREALLKVENQINEIVEDLNEAFFGTQIVITQEFDLLNEDHYKEAANALDEQKKIYMNKAETELQKVKGITDTVRKKVDDLMNSMELLHADAEEIIHLHGNEDLSELQARIKNQQADNAVSGEYDKMGDEAHQQRLRSLVPPYCEVHRYK